jgi:DNA polymerase III delta prime subunit
MFKKAVKHEAKLRLAIAGPSGSGKTYTALSVATTLGDKVAVVDTEHGSASKYADLFNFDVLNLEAPFHPARFVEAIQAADGAGYDVVILDSVSHAWNGTGGVLEIVEQASKRFKGNSYAGWQEGTPAHNQLINAIVGAGVHVIATMRSKQEYVLVERNGKTAPQKMGMAPVQRDGFEYEFDVFLDMDIENNAIVSKTRCVELAGKVLSKPGSDLAEILRHWLSGEEAPDYHNLALNSQDLKEFAVNAYRMNGTSNAFENHQRLADWYGFVAGEFDWLNNATVITVLNGYTNSIADGAKVREAAESARAKFIELTAGGEEE